MYCNTFVLIYADQIKLSIYTIFFLSSEPNYVYTGSDSADEHLATNILNRTHFLRFLETKLNRSILLNKPRGLDSLGFVHVKLLGRTS